MGISEQAEIKKLKKKIQELERMVETQTQLITILRSMPGCREVKLEKTAKKIAAKAGSNLEEKDSRLVKKRTTRKSE